MSLKTSQVVFCLSLARPLLVLLFTKGVNGLDQKLVIGCFLRSTPLNSWKLPNLS